MTEMTWEQKVAALNSIGRVELGMRFPGDWYASQNGVCVVLPGFERGGAGNGATPELAALDLWRERVDELPHSDALFIRSSQRCVRWNGFMWADVERPRLLA